MHSLVVRLRGKKNGICFNNAQSLFTLIITFHHKAINNREERVSLTNKEASTVLCFVVKHTGSGRARTKCRGKHDT